MRSFHTTSKVPKISEDLTLITQFGAETLKKPEGYISVIFTYNEVLTFGGSFDPAFSLRIVSVLQ